jgi:hypothetical protein
VAVVYGVLALIASLPGAVVLFVRRGAQAPAAETAVELESERLG